MKVMKYRLLSGKMNRPNEKGEMTLYKAPFDFIPTAGELAANKNRMQPIGEVEVADKVDVIEPVNTQSISTQSTHVQTAGQISAIEGTLLRVPYPSAIEPVAVPTTIVNLKLKEAVAYIGTVSDIQSLDNLLVQEADKKPAPRKQVLEALETRRDFLVNTAKEATNLESDKPKPVTIIEPFSVEHLI